MRSARKPGSAAQRTVQGTARRMHPESLGADIKTDFPILQRSVRGKRLVYLDSAATSHKPSSVLRAMQDYYETSNANVNRGVYLLAEESTRMYDESRKAVAHFIIAAEDEVVFTKSATEAINLIMRSYGGEHVGRGDQVVVSIAEHHSNFVPWQQLCKRKQADLIVLPVTSRGVVDLRELERQAGKRTRIVSLTHVSNVLGTLNPIREAAEIIKRKCRNAVLVVDACQSAAHLKLDVSALGCDFLVFSGHKLLGPAGIGVLYGKKALLDRMQPFLYGGDMIDKVTIEKTTWAEVPRKFEAGTQNPAAAVGLKAAIVYLNKIGMQQVERHGEQLAAYCHGVLSKSRDIEIYSPAKGNKGIVSFNLKGIHPHDVAQILDTEGIAIRAGHHCCQPLMSALTVHATCRASFHVYNTREDVDILVKGLEKAMEVFNSG